MDFAVTNKRLWVSHCCCRGSWVFCVLCLNQQLNKLTLHLNSNVTLIALIDRIRMLDNDLIRLNQKLTMILEHQEEKEKQDEINKNEKRMWDQLKRITHTSIQNGDDW